MYLYKNLSDDFIIFMFLQEHPEDPLETPTSSLAVEYLDHRRKCAEAHNAKALQVIHNFFTT